MLLILLLLPELHTVVSDAVSVGDVPTLTIPELYRALSDTIALTDASTLVLPELYRSIADALAVSDDPTILLIEPDLGISVDATNPLYLIRGVKVTA